MSRSGAASGRERAVRVFVSSTFHDMQDERDELVKRAFPRLRQMCEQRGVAFTEVDLRWGISDEKRAEGAVLPICLEEIRRCRPYFVGLLGERYGWVPSELPAELVEREPWLAERSGASVTELEIVDGVLRDPQTTEFAFFYFRDPRVVAALPPEQRAGFVEEASDEEVAAHGPVEAERRAVARRVRLAALKERIRASGVSVHEGFTSPQDLGELVFRDLAAVIDRRFPADSTPTPEERERAAHAAFAVDRARFHVGRAEALDSLDAHAIQETAEPIVVTGPAGIGSSALLATWVMQWRAAHPDVTVVEHFVGATPASTSATALAHRLLIELRDVPDEDVRTSGDVVSLRERLQRQLAALAATGERVLLVVAGLDRLDDRDGGLELAWLPRTFPSTVRVVLSARPGRPLDEARRRGWRVLELPPLSPDDRRELVTTYLAGYGKALTAAQTERIVHAQQTQSPLYLRTLLEELRLFGSYEQVDARIDAYLAADDTPELFGLVLDRCVDDYDRDRRGLTSEVMTLLWGARRGLAEDELLELLGGPGEPLPHAVWAPLFLAVEASLSRRAGLLSLGHPYLAEAVARRFLPTEQDRRATHARLAEYFSGRPTEIRALDELPWQLAQAGEWERLRDLLADPPVFGALWQRDRFALLTAWTEIEAATSMRMADAYAAWATCDVPHRTIADAVDLLRGAGHLAEALVLSRRRVELAEAVGDPAVVAHALDAEAEVHARSGEPDEALALFAREEELCRAVEDWYGVGRALNNEAIVLAEKGAVAAAIERYEQAARGWRLIEDRAALAATLGNEATLLVHQGDLDRAAALFEEQADLDRAIGDPVGLSVALDGIATVLMNRGDHVGALKLLTEEEAILRRYGQREGLAICLGNQADARRALGDTDAAARLFGEAEAVSREIGDRRGEAESIGRRASMLVMQGRYDEAEPLLARHEAVARELGLAGELELCLGNQAIVLRARGDLAGASRLLAEKVEICRQLGDLRGLAVALGNQGNIALMRGDTNRALELYDEKERIDRQLDNPEGLAHVLWSKAGLMLDRGDFERALTLIDEEIELRRHVGNPDLLAHALMHRVEAHARLGRIQDAHDDAVAALTVSGASGLGDLAASIAEVIRALDAQQ